MGFLADLVAYMGYRKPKDGRNVVLYSGTRRNSGGECEALDTSKGDIPRKPDEDTNLKPSLKDVYCKHLTKDNRCSDRAPLECSFDKLMNCPATHLEKDGETGESEQNIREGVFPFGDVRHLRAVENQSSLSDSKPSFKDAQEGIDVRDLRIAGKILREFIKIMEVEVK